MLVEIHILGWLIHLFFLSQLVASADCAGALDVIDDLQQLQVIWYHLLQSFILDFC